MGNDNKNTTGGSLHSFANLDFARRERTGIAEAILAEGKSADQVVALVRDLALRSGIALSTRVTSETARKVTAELSSQLSITYNETARTLVAKRSDYQTRRQGGRLAVVAAGTSDLQVAEEARVTAESMGCDVFTFYDVGIAGLHRLVQPLQVIEEKNVAVIVAVAGMEGALPSVIRGLVSVPVIGVPVSTGYGYGGKGEAALMTMLQSCAPGLTVVNIDNGFGAGATAALIANRMASGSNGSVAGKSEFEPDLDERRRGDSKHERR